MSTFLAVLGWTAVAGGLCAVFVIAYGATFFALANLLDRIVDRWAP